MQVLPTQDARAAFLQSLAASQANEQQNADLSDLFSKHLAAAVAGSQAGANGNGLGRPVLEQNTSQPAANTATGALGVDSSGPYGQLVVGSTELRDSKVGAEDFAALKDGLKEHGFTDDDLGRLEAKLSSPQGLTWGELVSSVQQVATRLEEQTREDTLTAEEKRQLLSFFGKIGFTPQQSDALVADLAGGRTKSVFSQVAGKLGTMDKDKTVSFDAGELAALGKGLRLTGDASQKLAALASGINGQELSVGGIAHALAAIGAQVLNDGQTRVALGDSLRQLVGGALQTASGKLANQKKSSATDDTAASAAAAAAKQTANAEATAKTSSAAETQDIVAKSKVEPGHEQSAKALDSVAGKSKKKNAGKQGDGSSFNLPTAKANAPAPLTPNDRAAIEKAWNDFFGATHAATSLASSGSAGQAATAKAADAPILSNPLAALGQAAGMSLGNAQAAADKLSETARLIIPQVDAAIFQNAQNGVAKLTLELDPVNLGKMSVMLTTKGDEVKAVLRPESPEAAAALREGLAAIKKSLEEQGLKVTKLEVQQGPAQQFSSSNWQGSSQHNQAWQQHQQNFSRRMNRGLASTGAGLAQDVQSIPQQARTAASGIDVMA